MPRRTEDAMTAASRHRGPGPSPSAAPRRRPERAQLARALGNDSYGRLIQPRLEVGRTDDPLEREAEHVAEQVTRTSEPAAAPPPVTQARGQGGPTPVVRREPLPEETDVVPSGEVKPQDKTNQELAGGIISTQIAILEGWKGAIHRFAWVLQAASDKSAHPDFVGVVRKYFEDKITGALISQSPAPGTSDAFDLLGKLEEEVKRAAAAQDSATLRDFLVGHHDNVTRLVQKLHSTEDDFKAKVRMVGQRGGADAGVMRIKLINLLERLDFLLLLSTPEGIFRYLSEQWIRQSTIKGSLGYSYPARVVIRVESDLSVRKAHIQGTGGQKIAEQLVKDAGPKGVDVWGLKVRRRVLYYSEKSKSLWSAQVEVDENNKDVSAGATIDGRYSSAVYQRIMARGGLAPTTKLSGDD